MESFMDARNWPVGREGEAPRRQARFTCNQNHFCETTIKRFRVHLLSFLSEQSLPLEQHSVEALSESLQNELKQLHANAYLSRLFALRRQLSKQAEQGASANGMVPAANLITSDFSRQASQLFGACVEKYLEGVRRQVGPELLREEIEAFRVEFLQRANRQTMKILELFGVENRAHQAGAYSQTKQASCKPENKIYVISYLQDLFGRGLLYPMELYHEITGDEDVRRDPDAPALPRKLCFHILAGIRKRLIGAEKYDKINARLLKLLTQATEKDCDFNVRECNAILMEETNRLHLMEHMLHCLDLLTHSSRREQLIQNINASIRGEADVCESPPFNNEDLSTLCNAWARFLYDNYALIPSKRTTKIVLERYLPEKAGALRMGSTV
jgi:hypothetical protein